MADIEIIKDNVDEYLKAVDAAKQRGLISFLIGGNYGF